MVVKYFFGKKSRGNARVIHLVTNKLHFNTLQKKINRRKGKKQNKTGQNKKSDIYVSNLPRRVDDKGRNDEAQQG